MGKNLDFHQLTTFQIAYNMYANIYTDEEKKLALSEISKRDVEKGNLVSIPENANSPVFRKAKTKLPLKGSKTERIFNLLKEGMDGKLGREATDVYRILKKKGETISPSEVYRVGRDYWPEKFANK